MAEVAFAAGYRRGSNKHFETPRVNITFSKMSIR